jgi:type II secretory pathway pseudopilin PulG
LFSLIELIITLALIATISVGIFTVFSQAQAEPAARQAQAKAAFEDAQRKELVQDLLDQAQVIVGASNVYASEHNGNWPMTIRELTEGRYLDSSVLPDTRVSSQPYQLVKDADGFSVRLLLKDGEVCEQIDASAAQNGKSRNGSFYPYDCYKEMKTFVFRP